jgi:hypothetical protein
VRWGRVEHSSGSAGSEAARAKKMRRGSLGWKSTCPPDSVVEGPDPEANREGVTGGRTGSGGPGAGANRGEEQRPRALGDNDLGPMTENWPQKR